jgi:CrcB protein
MLGGAARLALQIGRNLIAGGGAFRAEPGCSKSSFDKRYRSVGDVGSQESGGYKHEMNYLLVFLGGGIGAALRHGVSSGAFALLGLSFPFATLFVNVVGSLVMGMLAELFLLKAGGSQEVKLFLTTGLLGGFTTFSAFSLDAATMWQRGDHLALCVYLFSSVGLSIGALFFGMAAVRFMT